jgi:hypothetical protein
MHHPVTRNETAMRTTVITYLSGSALLLAATVAPAQSVAIYGNAEAAGYGEGSALVGGTISPGRQGLQPYLSVNAYSFRYRSVGGHSTATAIAPSVGLLYATPTSNVLGGVGYVFLSDETPSAASAGVPVGGENSVFVSGQYSYWGDGSKDVELLGSYALESEYLWSRASAMSRMGPDSKLFAGGEVGLQGSFAGPSTYRFQAGPRISYRISPTFRMGGAVGIRAGSGTGAPPMTGYARIEFLALPGMR